MKKNKLIPIILACANLLICLPLLIFFTPKQVPLIINIHEKILFIGSKWWLIFGITLPFIFMILAITKKNRYTKLIYTELIILVFYINMLAFSYFCTEQEFNVGNTSKIPFSVVLFLPLSLWMFIYGSLLKGMPYKNKLGLKSKNTQTTEFIWKQAHIQASYHYRLWGLILLIVSIVFIFIRHPLIEFGLFIIGYSIPRLVIEQNAIKMTKKYKDMQQRQEKYSKKKSATNS